MKTGTESTDHLRTHSARRTRPRERLRLVSAPISDSLRYLDDLPGFGKRLRFIHICIAARLEHDSPVRILDVGCGNGSYLSLPLAALGYEVTGVDPHRNSIEVAQQLSNGSANFVCATVQELPPAQFDAVILSEVLEHLEDPEGLLRASLRFLAPDGWLFVTVPNGYGEFEWDWWLFRKLRLASFIDRVRRHRPSQSCSECHSGHVQFFTLGRLRKIFRQCGLEVVHSAAGPLASGPFIAYTVGRFAPFVSINTKITDWLPLSCASGWYFALRLS